MVMLNIDVVMKRLQDIRDPTQEAIETMTLWIMHYKDKASIDVIVQGWMNAFKVAKTDEKRITLFYVMNHVVQKAKMKNMDALIISFQPHVLTSIGIGKKSPKVKAAMKKCLECFGPREVFTSATMIAMKNLLEADDAFDTEETVLDIDNDEIVRKVTSFISAENVVADMMKTLHEGDFDYKERVRNGMKDREEGAHVLEEIHTAINVTKQVRSSMEARKKKMIELIETLELAKRVYLHQKREVLVVEEAYTNFRDGIKTVHDELTEMEATGVYPGVTPPREAPSPTADEDIYATGVENAIQHFRAPETWDNRQAIDMEMDEEDRPQASIPIPIPIPIPQDQQPSLKSRIDMLGLIEGGGGAEKVIEEPDFSKPPPIFNMTLPPPGTSSAMSAFGVQAAPPKPSPEQPANVPLTISRSQHADIQQIMNKINQAPAPNVQIPPPGGAPGGAQSIYQMLLKQQGFGATSSSSSAPPAGISKDCDERSGYTARFAPSSTDSATELRKFSNDGPSAALAGLNPAAFSKGYQARFDIPPGIDITLPPPIQPLISPQGYPARPSADPRLAPNTGYQAKFEHPHEYHAKFDSPPATSASASNSRSGGGYQGRFEHEHRDHRRDQQNFGRSPERGGRFEDRNGGNHYRGGGGGNRGGFRGGNDRYHRGSGSGSGNRDWRGGNSSRGNYNNRY
ncbi:unnamed protein product [Caenorhabditis angaria]|uniref:CID domain-containing protein n=1 Tax=Caenorhabditis angaria TaxID=860376 RepID=A0A9P1MUB7_9PELO|nr:unnamed protein product [Caenorhabditis angaria]